MQLLFYISSFIALLATVMVITRYQPIHALLYLVVSFLAVAMIFLSLGAPFVAVLEVIIYAGAIMVLFIFVVMMLNLDKETAAQERKWLTPKVWLGPSLLVLVLLGEMIVLLLKGNGSALPGTTVPPRAVALSLYGPYLIAVELAGFLLMAGIVGAAHIGQHKKKHLHRFLEEKSTIP
ncbi:NADH-quinone oxidoreductase subunit J [Flavihumibacter petaseus]|uniref:NADH-quinone oxidoreductase subunit J n=1 Tax=Flavihumibacter petaseus NBRC 106054 TaxID=1220578 RepID=A0A0E9MUM5_9BACT|nr:NADH-quinone oxidoreductase subunit J [Flavihumibacter petaseus]GAO41121.1 NADH--quinone oxidoreductase subunit J [Flavihumibacter petaseus NBRC 106054]